MYHVFSFVPSAQVCKNWQSNCWNRGKKSWKPFFLLEGRAACSLHQTVLLAYLTLQENQQKQSLERDYSKPNIAATSMPACSRVWPNILCLEVKLERPESQYVPGVG